MTDPRGALSTAFLESWNSGDRQPVRYGPGWPLDRYHILLNAPVDLLLNGGDELSVLVQGEQSGNPVTERIPVFLIETIRYAESAAENAVARLRLRRPHNCEIVPMKIDFNDLQRVIGSEGDRDDLWAVLEEIGAIPTTLRESSQVPDASTVPESDEEDQPAGPICRVDHRVHTRMEVFFCSILGCWP